MKKQRPWRPSWALLIAISLLLSTTVSAAESGGAQGTGADTADADPVPELPPSVLLQVGSPAPYTGILAHPDRWRLALSVAAAADACEIRLAESGPSCAQRVLAAGRHGDLRVAQVSQDVDRWRWIAAAGWSAAIVATLSTVAIAVLAR